MSRSALAEKHPWTLPWWKADGENLWVMIYIVAIHVLAITGLILFPLPGLEGILGALLMACVGGLGTTVGYHRALAHRAVKLHPVVEQILDFLCVFQRIRRSEHLDRESSQSPRELRHDRRRVQPAARRILVGSPAMALSVGTIEHAEVVPGHDADRATRFWAKIQVPLVAISLCFGYFLFGWAGLLLARRHPHGSTACTCSAS